MSDFNMNGYLLTLISIRYPSISNNKIHQHEITSPKVHGVAPFFSPISSNSLNLNTPCSYPYLGRDLISYLDIKISNSFISLNII
jgi:hypothetical protein